MIDNNTIFDLQQSRNDSEFIEQNACLEIEVCADIIETLEGVPYISSLFRLGKVFTNYIDYRFFRKLGRFLKIANETSFEIVAEFIENLSLKDKKRISDYLTQLLYSAEEEAELMGKIYKRRMYKEIDNDMMLRLCSIVSRAYITDLNCLGEYMNESETNTYVTDNLVALGILADAGNVYEESGDGWKGTGFGPTKHVLNEIGITLHQILFDLPITSIQIKRSDIHYITRPITTEEISEIWKQNK